MLRFAAKTFGMFLLALAMITAVLDLTRSVANSQLVVTALGLEWRDFHVDSLQYFQVGIERHLGLSWLWSVVIQNILLMPSWLVFFILAVAFFSLGRAPNRGWQKKFGR